jgi:hypothetical protein
MADTLPAAVRSIPLDSLTAVGLRMSEDDQVEDPEWWRVELSISRNDGGDTVVHSVAGVAKRAQGPFREPSLALQALIGRLTVSCTW